MNSALANYDINWTQSDTSDIILNTTYIIITDG